MVGIIEYVAKVSFIFVLIQSYSLNHDTYSSELERQKEAESLTYTQHEEVVKDDLLQKEFPPSSYYDEDIDENDQVEQTLMRAEESEQEDNGLIESTREHQLKKLKDLSASIYPGVFHDNVKTVQDILQYFGYYEGDIDGIYGPLTKKALEIAENKFDVTLVHEEEQNGHEQKETKGQNIDMTNKQRQYNKQSVIEVAQSLTGIPYVWGGESTNGFDCSGFIQYVFSTQGIDLPRTVNEQWHFSNSVNALSEGDLVFFETTKSGPSHLGIYLGEGKFIHAGSSRGVEVSELDNPYWKERYLGAREID